MAHTLLFGLHIATIVVVGLDFNGYVFHDLETETFEAFALDGVVGHQTHFGNAEKVEDLSTNTGFLNLIGCGLRVFRLP